MLISEFQPKYLRIEPLDEATLQVWFTQSKLADDVNIEQMGHELTTLVDEFKILRLVISFTGLEYLTSAALGKLITLHRRLHRAQGQLVLCEFSDGVLDILRTSRLEKYFRIAGDREAAIAMLDGGASAAG